MINKLLQDTFHTILKLLVGINILVILSFNNIAHAQSNYIPPQAFKYKDLIRTELNEYFKHIPDYNYVPSLIEHESCIHIKHKRCWQPTSSLKTSREEGAGLSMITRTYREDGSIRFDKLAELRDQYKKELKDAKWETIYQRPDVQIRMMTLMLRDDYKKLYNVENENYRLQMVNAAYNGGINGLLKERRACGLSKTCDAGVWFDNVERFCLKSKKFLYGTRSACDINRHHTSIIFKSILPKYQKQYFIKGELNVDKR